MKIIYVITTNGVGLGGHYYSLKVLAEAIGSRPDIEAEIINFGAEPAKALKHTQLPITHIPVERGRFFRTLARFDHLIKQSKPCVIHAFDFPSLCFARIIGYKRSVPVVFTKCGGSNVTRFFPIVPEIILFSRENLDHLQKMHSLRKCHFHVIPNRTNEVPQDPKRIARIRSDAPHGMLTFLRIARFSPHYDSASLQLLNLVKRLRTDGLSVRYVQIGSVQSKESEQLVSHQLDALDKIYTSDEYTIDASALIDAGDILLGSGRSFMEAAARERILLAPVRNSSTPALVTRQNVECVMYANISPRTIIPDFDEEKNYLEIRALAIDPLIQQQYKNFAKDLYLNHFSIHESLSQYETIYASSQPLRLRSIPLLNLLLHCWITFFGHSR